MDIATLNFDERGLLPVITQDALSGEVLMLAYANREAIEKTLATQEAHYYSRSRQELWQKGATSGHVQRLVELRFDCDSDALLYRVEQQGVACHTGQRSCFYRSHGQVQTPSLGQMMAILEAVVVERLERLPEGSYVARLHEKGLGYIAQKVVEEAGETIVAALEHKPQELLAESADLFFHLTVLLRESGLSLADVAEVLHQRYEEKQPQPG
jgi:phosphoribosyl-ATP pyrophosphohydrolase/phosphoribosyl-AMP cyclohydrolase